MKVSTRDHRQLHGRNQRPATALWIGAALVIALAFSVKHRPGPNALWAADPQPPPQIDFHDQVWPVLKQKCVGCHNPKKSKGDLDMSSREAMLRGGHSGPAMVPGDAEESLMIELIDFDEMPPRDQKDGRVTKDELKTLRQWIAGGAVVPEEPDQSQDRR